MIVKGTNSGRRARLADFANLVFKEVSNNEIMGLEEAPDKLVIVLFGRQGLLADTQELLGPSLRILST